MGEGEEGEEGWRAGIWSRGDFKELMEKDGDVVGVVVGGREQLD